MAQFRATMSGQRGEASRLGSAKSGLVVNCNGWHDGVRVDAGVDKDGHDEFVISANGGSAGDGLRVYIGTVKGGKFYLAGKDK